MQPLSSVPGLLRSLTAPLGKDATDHELLERFVETHDEAAATAIVKRHGRMVQSVCRRILRNLHDAEDAFQATFLVLSRKAGAIRKRELLPVWLHRVAVNNANALVNAGRHKPRHALEQDIMDSRGLGPSEEAMLAESGRVLDDAICRLPEKYREAIVLRYLKGCTNAEAAALLGCPVGTLDWRLAKARELLHQLLSRKLTVSAATFTMLLKSSASASGTLTPALVAATVQATLTYPVSAAAGVSSTAAALAERVMHSMLIAKIRLTVLATLFLASLFVGGGTLLYAMFGGEEARRHVVAPGQSNPAAGLALAADADPRKDNPEQAFTELQAAKWVLEQGGHIRGRDSVGKELLIKTPEDLPTKDFFIHVIGLPNAKVRITDRDIARLSNLMRLEELDIAQSDVTDVGLKYVKEFTSLKKLYLHRCKSITDAGLKELRSLQNLSLLKLEGTKVTGASLKTVGKLMNLEWVSLAETKIAGNHLAHLRSLEKLRYLNLRATRTDDAGLRHLRGFKNLKQLILMDTPTTDTGLDHLKQCVALKYVDLARTPVTETGAKRLLAHLGDQGRVRRGQDGAIVEPD
jgi:RNA polymerase sigma factor (sigma-70 family)